MSLNFPVRFSDNVSDLKKHLAEGLNQIEVTRAAVDRMASSLGGDKLIRAAHTYAEALHQIGGEAGAMGGVAKLTFNELERGNTLLEKAVAKYTALGQAIPEPIAALRQLINAQVEEGRAAEAAEKGTKSFGLSLSSINGLLATFGVGLSVGAFVAFGKNLLSSASALTDLSAKTGLTTEALQRLDYVGGQSGVAIDAFADAAFKLGIKLSTGSTSAKQAVHDLGLSFDALKNQTPEKQFDAIALALSEMESPQERNRIGFELFGKSFASIAPALVKGYGEMADAARVAGDAQVQAADRAGDRWDAFVKNQKARFITVLGDAILFSEALSKLSRKDAETVADLELRGGSLFGKSGVQRAQEFIKQIAKEQADAADASAGSTGKAVAVVESYVDQLRKAQAEVAGLTSAQRAELIAGEKSGASTEVLSNKVGISEFAIRLFKTEIEKATEAQKKYGEALDQYTSAAAPGYLAILNKIGNATYEGIAADHARGISTEALAQIYKVTTTNVDQVIKNEERFAEAIKDTDKYIAESRDLAAEAGATIAKSFGGQTVLKDLAVQTGQLQLGFKTLLTPIQQLGFVMQDVTQTGKDHFLELHDAITDDITDITSVMKSQNVLTRDSLKRLADEFKRQYDAMKASGLFTTKELAEAWKRYEDSSDASVGKSGHALEELSGTLGDLSQDFTQLATIAGGSFGEVARGIGLGVKAADTFTRSIASTEKIMKAATARGGGLNAGEVLSLASSWLGAAFAVYEFGQSVAKALDAAREAERRAAFAKNLAHDFETATQFSEALSDSIRQLAKDLQSLNLSASIAQGLEIGNVIEELGGISHLSGEQLATVRDRLLELQQVLQVGGITGSRAFKQLDETVAALGQNLIDQGKLVDAFFLRFVDGGHSALPAVQKIIDAQLASSESGITSALKVNNDAYAKRADLLKQQAQIQSSLSDADAQDQKKIADLRAKIAKANATDAAAYQEQIDNILNKQGSQVASLEAIAKQLKVQENLLNATGIASQSAADAIAGGLLGIISSQVRAGKSFGEAVRDAAPGIEALKDELARAGIEGGAAFQLLKQQADLFTGEVTGPALTSIEGYAQGLVGLHNAGLLNQDTFAGITEQIGHTRDALVNQGVDGQALLVAMQSPLQKLWELEKNFGYQADASTQALIDQAQAQGLVGEAHKSVQEQSLDLQKRMTAALEGIAKFFGVQTEGAEESADATKKITDGWGGVKLSIEDATEAMRRFNGGISGGSLPTGFLDPGRFGATPEPGRQYAVGSFGLQEFGLGTPATLHGREAVVTEAEYSQWMKTGPGRGGAVYVPDQRSVVDTRPIVVQVQVDGKTIATAIAERVTKDGTLRADLVNGLGLA